MMKCLPLDGVFWSLDTAGAERPSPRDSDGSGVASRWWTVRPDDGGTVSTPVVSPTKALVTGRDTPGGPMTRAAGTPARLARWAMGCAVCRTHRKGWSD